MVVIHQGYLWSYPKHGSLCAYRVSPISLSKISPKEPRIHASFTLQTAGAAWCPLSYWGEHPRCSIVRAHDGMLSVGGMVGVGAAGDELYGTASFVPIHASTCQFTQNDYKYVWLRRADDQTHAAIFQWIGRNSKTFYILISSNPRYYLCLQMGCWNTSYLLSSKNSKPVLAPCHSSQATEQWKILWSTKCHLNWRHARWWCDTLTARGRLA